MEHTATHPLVQFSNVSRIYEQSESVAIRALQDVSFSIAQGEFVAITGHSGSGKSTLLNLIGLIDTPTEGSVIVDGKDVKEMSELGRTKFRLTSIGFVFQFFNLLDGLTALENIAFQVRLQGYSEKKANHKASEILDFLDLSNRGHLQPRELSGGEQQRVAIGRAVAKDSKILLTDEPTAHLDTKNGEVVMRLLRKINAEYGRTIIVVTHEPEEAKLTDREIVLKDGRVHEIKRPSSARAYMP